MKIELWCKPENRVLGHVELGQHGAGTEVEITERMLKRSYEPEKGGTLDPKKIQTGAHLQCPRCGNPAYFRGQDGEEFAAVPGMAKAVA